MPEDLDRANSEHAAEVMETLCPAESDRKLILGQLLRSVAVANGAGPQSWAVTLFNNGFRLNVGSVEALTFFDGHVRVFIHGSFPAAAQQLGEVLPCSLKSCPQPSHAFVGSLSAFRELSSALSSAHEAYVRGSAITQSGKPRRTSFARSHSPGLYAYASRVVGDAGCIT